MFEQALKHQAIICDLPFLAPLSLAVDIDNEELTLHNLIVH